MTRKTKKMVAVEERFHQPLEKILPEMVTEEGLSRTAEQLGYPRRPLGTGCSSWGSTSEGWRWRPGRPSR